jgi:hypothetical protein
VGPAQRISVALGLDLPGPAGIRPAGERLPDDVAAVHGPDRRLADAIAPQDVGPQITVEVADALDLP